MFQKHWNSVFSMFWLHPFWFGFCYSNAPSVFVTQFYLKWLYGRACLPCGLMHSVDVWFLKQTNMLHIDSPTSAWMEGSKERDKLKIRPRFQACMTETMVMLSTVTLKRGRGEDFRGKIKSSVLLRLSLSGWLDVSDEMSERQIEILVWTEWDG